MGDTKNNQKPTKPRKLGLMDRAKNLLPRKQHTKADKDTAKNFIDHIEFADECLGSMIQTKESDLGTEKGKEVENQQKIAILKAQNYHLEQIAALAHQYQDI